MSECFAGFSVRECTSYTSLQVGTESIDGLGSISSVLSSAMVSILAFPDEAGTVQVRTRHRASEGPTHSMQDPNFRVDSHSEVVRLRTRNASDSKANLESTRGQAHEQRSTVHPLDFTWLRERCDHDEDLVLEVLKSFCEQGQHHINSLNTMYHSKLDAAEKVQRISFHSVNQATHPNRFKSVLNQISDELLNLFICTEFSGRISL